MADNDLTRVVERTGQLRNDLGGNKKTLGVVHAQLDTSFNQDIGKAARKAGYNVGDVFKYIIIVQPDRRA